MSAATAVRPTRFPAWRPAPAWLGRTLAVGAAGAVVALTVASGLLHARAWGAPLWIDEGITIGISSHPLAAIPEVLRQDGSPPLYYLLLHVWMGVAGRSPQATHELSWAFAVLCVPAGWWAATAAFGRFAALCTAALLALSPYLGLYADETRMYSLVALLALLATGAFLRAYVLRAGRRHVVAFSVLLAALLYTHGWGIFFGAAAAVAYLGLLAFASERRPMLVDGLVGFGGAALLYAPWLPTLAYQAAHTGAPWSHRPKERSLERALSRMLSGQSAERLLISVAGVGALLGLVRGSRADRRGMPAVLGLAVLTLALAFAWSRATSPAWAVRYFVIVMAPLAVALGAGLGRLGPVGPLVIALVFALGWHGRPATRTLERKSNVAHVASVLGPRLRRGSLVFSTQPEQVPVLRYYLPPGLRYATPLGPVRDPQVMDWRDALPRLDAARYAHVVPALLRSQAPGTSVLLVQPEFSHPDSPWTRRIRRLAHTWGPLLRSTLRVRRVLLPRHGYSRATVTAVLMTQRSRR